MSVWVTNHLCAQAPGTNEDASERAYRKSIDTRADKIVSALNLEDPVIFKKIRSLVAQQYIDLRAIDDARDSDLKKISGANTPRQPASDAAKTISEQADAKTAVLHERYISGLSAHLDKNQVDQIKNGMTYNVLPLTYKGYLDMLPRLTAEEQKFIWNALVEAREHAMDAGSSEKKHAWFGKYKGRINNYLSGHGYDMKKESKEWQQRMKAQSATK